MKNLVVFGFFGLSSWATLNLIGVTVEKLPSDERAALVADGTLSKLSSIDAFGPIAKLEALLPPIPPAGDPELDAVEKSNGQPNMNHRAMLAASRLRLPDAVAALRADPGMYVAVLMVSACIFHFPPNEFHDLRRNLGIIQGWVHWVNATLGLQLGAWESNPLDLSRSDVLWMRVSFGAVLISLLFLAASWRVACLAWAAVWQRRALPPELITMVLVVWTGVFVILVSSMLDVLENNRARYTVAPLLTLGAIWLLLRIVRARQ